MRNTHFISPCLRLFLLMLALMLSLTTELWAASDLPETITSSDGVTMMLIPEGSFLMGSDEPDLQEYAQKHRVHLDNFYIDAHTVTNAQFTRFLNAVRPDEEKFKLRWQWLVIRPDLDEKERAMMWPTEIGYERGDYVAYEGYEDFPVVSVSWFAADAYCTWAKKRLPTEAEWEKAARGKLVQKRFSWGDSLPTTGVNFNQTWTDNQLPAPLVPAVHFLPNGYGLYNITGNVWEWVSDWFHPQYYRKSPRENPPGPESGFTKVLRGGSWFNPPNTLRVAVRNFMQPVSNDETIGFRCALGHSDQPAAPSTGIIKSKETRK